ncbi:aldose epimerase family protein [Enterococcus sp. DIV0800]|uniref:aldose epimerase family protein n=1 Tax=unclassified Enterococcus TaxID=2608891 RepID=UPI003D2FA655
MNKREFGILPNGRKAYLFDFENEQGLKMTVSNLGATLINLWVPDKNNQLQDVVLGYDQLQQYLNNTKTFFGASILRNANRVAGASFELAGQVYQLNQNEGENNLHSGPAGFQLRLWDVQEIDEKANRITFRLMSPAGDQGFPGALDCQTTYQLKSDGTVSIAYSGLSDATTIFNPTNHSYFNLNGHASGTIVNHSLQMKAAKYTPVKDRHSIPTGDYVSVTDTPFDFTKAKTIATDIEAADEQLHFTGGYDHNFVLAKPIGAFEKIGRLVGDISGISMEVATNLPGIQFYSGNFVENELGKAGVRYQARAGLCLETQYFPNAINETHFDSPVLRAGEQARYQTDFKFS